MDAKLNGGPAFPTLAVLGDKALSEGGLTVRDAFALAVLPTAWREFYREWLQDDSRDDDFDGREVAWHAYVVADAMLAARASGAQPAQPAPDADGWIVWYGGTNPAGQDANVEVVLRSGRVVAGLAARFFWDRRDTPGDIVRYRVVREAKP